MILGGGEGRHLVVLTHDDDNLTERQANIGAIDSRDERAEPLTGPCVLPQIVTAHEANGSIGRVKQIHDVSPISRRGALVVSRVLPVPLCFCD